MRNWLRTLPQTFVQSEKKYKGLKYPVLLLLPFAAAICQGLDTAKALAHPKMRRRVLVGILSLSMLFTLLPINAFAAEAPTQSMGALCEHHAELTAEYGYVCEICGAQDSSNEPEEEPKMRAVTAGNSVSSDDENGDGYHDGDVAAIHAMIDNNGLSATKDAPASWDFALWDNNSTIQRITILILDERELTGALDVSDLTSLTMFTCGKNQLMALDVSGLTSLNMLFCNNNQLTTLDVSDLTSLSGLVCSTNQLTTLDLSSLTSLSSLYCDENPIASLKMPDGDELTVGTVTGGEVELTEYNDNVKSVTLMATADTEGGYAFESWTAAGITLTDETANPVTFTMDGTITITPVYNDTNAKVKNAIAAANAAKNGISVSDSAASSVANGTKFVTTAEMKALTDAIAAAQAIIDDSSSTAEQASAAVTALNNAVVAFHAAIKTGTYTSDSSGGDSSSDESSTDDGTPSNNNSPASGQTTMTVPVDRHGNATITVTDKVVADAIKVAQNAAKKGNLTSKMISVEIVAQTDQAATKITATLPKTVQETLISNKVDAVKITTGTITIGFSQTAIQQIKEQAKADVTITAGKSDTGKLTGDAKALIGSRPMFDFNATYSNGTKSISDFGGNPVSIAIPYTLGKGEVPGNLYAVYVDGNGKATKILSSSYDANQKAVIFTTSHFSQYGVGYQANYNFTDIASHWAKTDIEFVANRGLMDGASNTTFSPNTGMTRGMFVTALGRLAGVDSSKYTNTKFTDVAATAYYAPYVAWAVEKGITSGTTDSTFSPDKTITRQEMAVFLSNYAKDMGYKVPETRGAISFADNRSIGSWAAAAVKQMQMAGVLNGKNGNKFDPTGTATRAEVAATLHRYVDLVIDVNTAQGLDVNDSGSTVMYENGKMVRSASRTVGSATYTFNFYGEAPRKTQNNGSEYGNSGSAR